MMTITTQAANDALSQLRRFVGTSMIFYDVPANMVGTAIGALDMLATFLASIEPAGDLVAGMPPLPEGEHMRRYERTDEGEW